MSANKLTADAARRMREERAQHSLRELAARYGVSKETVRQIMRGTYWADAGGPSYAPRSIPAARPQKLTVDRVVELRTAYAAGDVTVRALARRYNLTPRSTWQTLTGQTWPDAGGPIHVPAPRAQPRPRGPRFDPAARVRLIRRRARARLSAGRARVA